MGAKGLAKGHGVVTKVGQQQGVVKGKGWSRAKSGQGQGGGGQEFALFTNPSQNKT